MYKEKVDELWDAYDADRNLTGETLRRGDPVPEGRYHLVVHVCIFNQKNELLLQQRQPWKQGWPNMWDVSVGGSAVYGDDSHTAAEREVQEELGLKIDLSGIRPRFSVNIARGFDDFYLIKQDVDIAQIRLQPEEVRAVKWASREEALHMVETGEMIPYLFLDQLFDMNESYGTRYRYPLECVPAEEKHLVSMLSLAEVVSAFGSLEGAVSEFDGLEDAEIPALEQKFKAAIAEKRAVCCLSGHQVVGILLKSADGMAELQMVHPEHGVEKLVDKLRNYKL